MKKILLLTATIAIVTILLFACRKNDTIEDNKPEDLFDNLVASRQSDVQIFELNAATGGTITGNMGAKITFPPNVFIKKPTQNIAVGTVVIALRESNVKSRWMMDGLSTTTGSNILESGGMLNLSAVEKSSGAELDLAAAAKNPNANLAQVVKAEIVRPANVLNQDMNLFLPDSSSQTGGNAPWVNAANFPFKNNPNNFTFQIPRFNWVNCDRFYNTPGAKTTLTVKPNLSGFAGASDISVMLVYRNISSIMRLPKELANFVSYTNSLPVDSQADIVLVGKTSAGKILFKVLPATTITPLLTVNITPEEVPGATVIAYLNSVN
jgi:hypothetical protein